ncbi:neutral protease 2-like protein [Corynespora cassiicola Philippines]|uniref:Neutral protease 2 n=1 Tax=Corynespora cassiicola Philippines TaxID=1448308 RepID=A0A2T2NQM8_CORCC|nr:neutral protease 2-like protein [Corynespora cassiicola Philippines]
MKGFAIAALAALASAVSIDVNKRDTPLEVSIELTGNTAVKAVITNTGSEDLKVLKTGTLFGDAPTEKVEVFQGQSQVAFEGIRLQIALDQLEDDAFQVIAAGETLEKTFDIAEMHDLSAGGSFDVVTTGAVPFAKVDSTEIEGAVAFSSNTVAASVDGAEAAKVRRAFLKRAIVQSDCTGTRRTAVVNGLANCRSLATTAASQANSNTAKMTEFFKSSSASTRSTVAGVFNRVASECGSSTGGVSRLYCTDVYPGGACSGGVIAYTVPSQSYQAYCGIFFNQMPATSRGCYAQTQASTLVHEVTHLSQVRGTSDYGGYGYNFVRSLSASQNLNHADTYTLFAQSIYAGC